MVCLLGTRPMVVWQKLEGTVRGPLLVLGQCTGQLAVGWPLIAHRYELTGASAAASSAAPADDWPVVWYEASQVITVNDLEWLCVTDYAQWEVIACMWGSGQSACMCGSLQSHNVFPSPPHNYKCAVHREGSLCRPPRRESNKISNPNDPQCI